MKGAAKRTDVERQSQRAEQVALERQRVERGGRIGVGDERALGLGQHAHVADRAEIGHHLREVGLGDRRVHVACV